MNVQPFTEHRSPHATISPLPQPKPGRRRRSQGMSAAGLLSLQLMERDGETVPGNVHRIDLPKEEMDLPSRTVELLLATLIWNELTAKQKTGIRRTLRILKYGPNADRAILQLDNMLNGKF